MNQTWLISAVLLALFLGALDALVMSAAMPTIIAELSGLHLYAWVYTAYFLARAVALPIFGKLSDLFAVSSAGRHFHWVRHLVCQSGTGGG
jgi:MFS family permease